MVDSTSMDCAIYNALATMTRYRVDSMGQDDPICKHLGV